MQLSIDEARSWCYWLARVRLPGGDDIYGTLTATDLADATGVARSDAERALRVLAHTKTLKLTDEYVGRDAIYELRPLPPAPRFRERPWSWPPCSLPPELASYGEILTPRGMPVASTVGGRWRERVMSIPGQRGRIKRREAARRRQEESMRSREKDVA